MSQIRIYLFSGEPPSEMTLPDCIAWLQDLLVDVADEDKPHVEVRFDSETEFDSHRPMLEISYYREETPSEQAERKAKELAKMEQRRNDELRMLAELQAKYGEGKP